MKAYKGFNKDMTCRGFQFEEGKEYTEDEAKLCECGFHACEYPLDTFNYYAPNESDYHEVELDDVSDERQNDDTKVVAKKIKIGAKLDIKGIIKASFDYIKEKCTNNERGGDQSALSGGARSALSGGDQSALSGGARSALSGGARSALSGGDQSALSGGARSALSGGDQSALSGGYQSALSGGYQSALSGGARSALSGGYQSALSGEEFSVVYGGEDAKVRGGLHSVLALQFWQDHELKEIKTAVVDGEIIKVDTWYKLDENGEFAEAEDD